MKPIQRKEWSSGKDRKRCWNYYLSTWIQLDLKAFTYVIFIYISKLIFALSQFELVRCCETKKMTNHFIWKGCHSCCVPSLSAFLFSSASSASSLQSMQTPFSKAVFTCLHQSEMPSEFLLPHLFHSPC